MKQPNGHRSNSHETNCARHHSLQQSHTVYLERAVRHLRDRGVDVPDALLAHVAPLGWEHVSLTGDYLWSEIDKPRERFRPLRTPGSTNRS